MRALTTNNTRVSWSLAFMKQCMLINRGVMSLYLDYITEAKLGLACNLSNADLKACLIRLDGPYS